MARRIILQPYSVLVNDRDQGLGIDCDRRYNSTTDHGHNRNRAQPYITDAVFVLIFLVDNSVQTVTLCTTEILPTA